MADPLQDLEPSSATPVWEKGDDYAPSPETSMFVAGIHVDDHGNAVECYGETAEKAAAIRDTILTAIKALSNITEAKATIKSITALDDDTPLASNYQ